MTTETPRERQIREALGTRDRQVEALAGQVEALGQFEWCATVLVNEQISASGYAAETGRWRNQLVNVSRVLEGARATWGDDGVSRETVLVALVALKDAGLVEIKTSGPSTYALWVAEWTP